MDSKDIMKYLPQILLAIGAIIGIAAFFVNWYGFKDFTLTGQKLMDYKDQIGWQVYVPLIILILGIVALIVGALPHCGVELDPKILNGIIAVIGIVMIILFICYFTKDVEEVNLGKQLQIGGWLGLIAGLIPVIVGALGFFNVFDNFNAPKAQ